MKITAEARWFIKSALPPRVETWFREPGEMFEVPAGGGVPRTDTYLGLGHRELGIKRRGDEEGMEIKGRIGSPAFDCRLGDVVFRPCMFAKWSTEAVVWGDAPTVEVEKTRWLRIFSPGLRPRETLLGAGAHREDPAKPGSLPPTGCAVEVTSLMLKGEHWWSFAAEAFAPSGSEIPIDLTSKNLRAALAWLSEDLPFDLRAASYQGYAEWLSSRGQSERR